MVTTLEMNWQDQIFDLAGKNVSGLSCLLDAMPEGFPKRAFKTK
jgi:hypothetical protein